MAKSTVDHQRSAAECRLRRVHALLERLMTCPLAEWRDLALAAPLPDKTPVDPVEAWIARDNVETAMFRFAGPEGKGVIRSQHELELIRDGTERMVLAALTSCAP